MVATHKLICGQQRTWASQRGIRFDEDGYTLSLIDNLFLPPSLEVEEEFRSGKGDELGSEGSRGKMQALHSSSALVLNVFYYWRNHDLDSLAKACGIPKGMTELRFEQTHPTSLGGIPPHLDIEFHGAGLKLVAVESKFTETYHRHTKRKMKSRYYEQETLWVQLPKCEELLRYIRGEEQRKTSFSYLDAPQLLKHILGLVTTFGTTGFQLVYLWYEVPSSEAMEHRRELEEFKNRIGDEVNFRDITYQELFSNIRKCPDVDRAYISYLAGRYFPTL